MQLLGASVLFFLGLEAGVFAVVRQFRRIFLRIVHRIAKTLDRAAEILAHSANFLGAENQHHNQQNDKELPQADTA